MKKLKVCVYAICKNEEKFVNRWMDSVSEADLVVVLDTGSNDKTVELLKKRGATVHVRIIEPWRFDVARNSALNLIPEDYDVCVSVDLDEVLEPGWRKKLELEWDDDTTRMAYNYNWSFDEYGNPSVSFFADKIHHRKNYIWKHPVHETLYYSGEGEEKRKINDKVVMNHYPDDNKSRNQYLKLLELAVEEDPENDRNTHYLGREYMYKQRWNECIDTLIRHLKLKNSTWNDERCASMRFIARSYKALKRFDEAKMWLLKAINEAPKTREPYVEYAMLHYELNDWLITEQALLLALEIKDRSASYINESFCWDSTIYDLLSIASYNLGKKDQALEMIEKAIKLDPKNKRLQKNKKIILKMKNNKKKDE